MAGAVSASTSASAAGAMRPNPSQTNDAALGDTPMADAHAHKPALVLEAMPPEILALILDFLIPQPPEIGETRPVAYDQLMVDEPWFDFTRCRRGLHSVCRASRLLADLALPLLYRVVAVWDERAMLLFLRTLYSKPHYGLWTRYFSCHITLTDEPVIREMRQLLITHLPSFQPARDSGVLTTAAREFLQMLRQFLPHMVVSDGDLHHVPQAILCFSLMYLTKLETLLLQIPISDEMEEYDALCSQIKGIGVLFESEPQSAPFQNIHTLLLQGDAELLAHFEDDDCDCEVPEVWGAQPRRYESLFSSFPKLATLEVSSDDGVWSLMYDEDDHYHHHHHHPHHHHHHHHHHDPQHPSLNNPPTGNSTGTSTSTSTSAFVPDPDRLTRPFLATIRHIYLHDSFAYPADLHHLLQNAPRLETLYMAPRRDDAYREPLDDNNAGAHAHPEALDLALAAHARHLRSLDVSWEDVRGFESLVGPEGGRLTALAGMEGMRSLCVQMALLYGSPQGVGEAPPLVELLPRNLEDLALEDWWWTNADILDELPEWDAGQRVRHYQAQHRYRVSALRVLTQFARDVRTRLQRLRKVVLLCKIPWTWVLEGAVPLEFHFEDVKRLFLAQGVEFSVKSDEI